MSEITKWAEALAAIIRQIEDAPTALHLFRDNMPPYGGSDERLEALANFWQAFVPDECNARSRWVSGFRNAIESRARFIESAASDVFAGIEREIVRLLDAGAQRKDGPLIRTADFTPNAVFYFTGRERAGPYCGAPLRVLPEGHWLRSVLPAEEYFLADSGPSVVLGSYEQDSTYDRRRRVRFNPPVDPNRRGLAWH